MASIRKRKKDQKTVYTVLYDYVDISGKRHQKSAGTFFSLAEAKKSKLDIESKKANDEFVKPSDKTVDDFFMQDWLSICPINKKWSYSTLQTEKNLLTKHILPEIGAMKIQNVKPLDIENLFAKLQQKKVEGPKTFGRCEEQIPYLSGTTLGHIYNVLHTGFQSAVEWELISENPVRLPKPKRDKTNIDIWDMSMIKTALDNIEHEQLHLLVHLSATLTLRNGEMCGLTWDCIDFDAGTLRVKSTMQRVNKAAYDILPPKSVFRVFPNKMDNSGSMLILKTPKTRGSERQVYLSGPLLKELRRRQQTVAKHRLYYGNDYHDYNLVFCLDDGTPVEPNLSEKWFQLWQRRHADLGLPRIKIHGLRHSSTTLLLSLSQSDVKTVQGFTGNSAKMILETYSHPQQARQKQLVKKLEELLYSKEAPTPSQYDLKEILSHIKKSPLLAQEVVSALTAE